MRLDIASQSDVGRRKRNNEDYCAIWREDTPNLALFKEGAMLCVADGLGGHFGGEIASKLAVATFKDCLRSPAPDGTGDPREYEAKFVAILQEAMAHANANIWQTNKDLVKKARPMGTTLLAGVIEPRRVFIANVGDSRAYHVRDGEIIAATEDHSWVDEQVKLGLMTKSEAEADSRKNLVTRCIGTSPEVPVDTYVWHTVPGDIVLLCTDGLVNMVPDDEIRSVFQRRGAAVEYASRLVNLANERGGRDNITVVVAQVEPTTAGFVAARMRAFWRKQGTKVVFGLLAAAYGAVCFAAGWLTHTTFTD